MLAPPRGRGWRGPRGVGMQPAQDLWGTDHHPSTVQPRLTCHIRLSMTPLNVQPNPDPGPSVSCLRSQPPEVVLTSPPSAPRGLRARPGSDAGRRG